MGFLRFLFCRDDGDDDYKMSDVEEQIWQDFASGDKRPGDNPFPGEPEQPDPFPWFKD